jgi:hypothetical protein
LGPDLTWRKGPFFGDKANFVEGKLVGKEAHARESHMQRRKVCKACMQENLTTLGLGFL